MKPSRNQHDDRELTKVMSSTGEDISPTVFSFSFSFPTPPEDVLLDPRERADAGAGAVGETLGLVVMDMVDGGRKREGEEGRRRSVFEGVFGLR